MFEYILFVNGDPEATRPTITVAFDYGQQLANRGLGIITVAEVRKKTHEVVMRWEYDPARGFLPAPL